MSKLRSCGGRGRALLFYSSILVLSAAACDREGEESKADVIRRMREVPLVRHQVRAATGTTGSNAMTPAKQRAMEAIPGRWKKFSQRRASPDSNLRELGRAEIERLEAMGYASGSRLAQPHSGVTFHDRARAYRGLNFYVSGHAPEAILMDMEGKVLHKWGIDLFDSMPSYKGKTGLRVPNHWRRAHLAPNGDVVAIYGGLGMVKLDKDSKLLWAFDDHVHHDLEVLEDGTVYTLVRRGVVIEELNQKGPVVMDSIVIVNPEGQETKRVSVFDCFKNSNYAPLIAWMPKSGDVLHTNTIEVLDGSQVHRSPHYKRGNVLLSFRHLDTIAIVDLEEERVVWARWGVWSSQHQPVLLSSGNMLIFDNRGLGERSRILEFDPSTQEILWSYAEGSGEDFYSKVLGSVQRLPGGNTLVSESDNGRIFELTNDNEVVWEFVNPYRAGDEGEFVASIYELIRLEPTTPHAWADPRTAALSIDISETAR